MFSLLAVVTREGTLVVRLHAKSSVNTCDFTRSKATDRGLPVV